MATIQPNLRLASVNPSAGVASYEPREPNFGGFAAAGREFQDAAAIVQATNERQDGIVAQAASNDLASREMNIKALFSQDKEGKARGQEFIDKYTTKFEAEREAVRSTLDSPIQQRVFDQHAQVAALRFKGALLGHQAQQTDIYNERTENTTIDVARRQVLENSNNQDAVSAGLAQLDWAINQKAERLGWSPEVIGVTKAKYMEAIAKDGIDLMIARPATTAQTFGLLSQRVNDGKLTGNLFVDGLSIDDLAQKYHQARIAVEQMGSAQKGELVSRTRDFQAFATGAIAGWNGDPAALAPTKEQYQAAFGKDSERLYRDEVGVYIDQARASQRLGSASAQERQQLIAEMTPTGVEGAAAKIVVQRHLIQANAAIEKALKDDPAGYVATSSSRVKSAYAAYQNDPSTFDRYLTESKSEQVRMGARPKALTAGEASSIAEKFTSSPPEKVAELVSGLEQQYGTGWPDVYAQLAEDKKIPPSAVVIPNMKDASSKSRLASLSAMKESELDGLIQQTDKKDIRNALQSQFQNAGKSFLAQSATGLQTVNLIQGQAEKLAILYKSQGKSANEAAKQAYDETVGWRYTFVDTYRVPTAGQNSYDANFVSMGARNALSDLKGLKVFTSPYPMRPAQLVEQSEDAIRANGFWATSNDEKGLVLKIRGQDNSEAVVKKADGSPVTMSFYDLQRRATDQMSEEAQAASEAREAAAKRLGAQ